MAIDSVPSCVAHGVAAADGTVNPYEKCSAFFTFASNQTFSESDNSVWLGASAGTILLVVLGILFMLGVLVAWVVTEHYRLTEQAARLRAAQVPRPAAPASPGPGVTPDL